MPSASLISDELIVVDTLPSYLRVKILELSMSRKETVISRLSKSMSRVPKFLVRKESVAGS